MQEDRSGKARLIAGRYALEKVIGKGSFGEIHLATDILTGEKQALKFESLRTTHPQLKIEAKFYKLLQSTSIIPKPRWYGKEAGCRILAMDCLGLSIEDHFSNNDRHFSVGCVVKIAIQMLKIIQILHTKRVIHRDIKPENFLYGLGEKANTLFLIDFGLSKQYKNPITGEHIEFREGKHLTGTPRYASLTNHLGHEQSRRDDMESIGYVLMYLLRGSLPWQGLPARTKQEKHANILACKLKTPISSLCDGYPPEFKVYLEYTRGLAFTDTPNYDDLITMFETLEKRLNALYFDWNIPTSAVYEDGDKEMEADGVEERRDDEPLLTCDVKEPTYARIDELAMSRDIHHPMSEATPSSSKRVCQYPSPLTDSTAPSTALRFGSE